MKGLDIKKWDQMSSFHMKELLKESFIQNPNSLEKLLNTENAELTHVQDKGKWGKEFPKILMELRSELKNISQSGEKTVYLAIDFKLQDLKLNIDKDLEKGYISEAKRNEMFEIINKTKVTNDKEFGDLINKLCR